VTHYSEPGKTILQEKAGDHTETKPLLQRWFIAVSFLVINSFFFTVRVQGIHNIIFGSQHPIFPGWWHSPIIQLHETNSYKKKQWRAAKQIKEETRKKPKPEEQEGMPQRQHCPPAIKRRGDRNP
jgi:hypothetical protein